MIIWKGYGILTFVFLILSFTVVELVAGKEFYGAHSWVSLFAYLLAGLLCFFVGRALNRGNGKVYIDKETGQEIIARRTHSFFFIKMEYWGFILPILGIVIQFTNK
ncbi:hypothetical protein [Clostridium manihotivorum]|uniref:DUF3899 domain-containing protein n=1 Tax=Clostridium manihotivorum TaxID=2320868 RepID=A0A3R5TJ17_9CLOT|nr:hypothetical protein [Clostridium manihotivorum]QAA34638.1 hypothetical protein C1I91_25060 [Clostridium manihotivorum]